MNADRDKSEQPCADSRCDAQTHPAEDDVRAPDATETPEGGGQTLSEVLGMTAADEDAMTARLSETFDAIREAERAASRGRHIIGEATTKSDGSGPEDCPHAGAFRYCDGCKASPCPIGLDEPATTEGA